jgi:TIR domain/WD40-like Beta Propeller Repeat
MAGEIFISYRRGDAAWARLLHAKLQAEGVEAWYDARIGAGQDWRIATARALEDSRIFVLLFTANAAESGDIAKELAAAVQEKKLVVPVRLENIAPKGAFLYELASRNWINAYEDTEVKLAELAKGLAQMVKSGAQDESILPFERSDDGQAAKARKGLRHPVIISVTAIAAIAASTLAAWLLWPAQRWTVESSRPFISTLALEEYPAFSPNGTMLAYTSTTDPVAHKIYVRSLAGGAGIKITGDAYDDVSPAWSSDGARLAYVVIKPGEPCRIMVVTVPAGEAREAGRCSVYGVTPLTWQPGTPFVYYLDGKNLGDQAIFRLDVDTEVRLMLPDQMKGSIRDKNPSPITALQASPDGKSLAYLDGGGWGGLLIHIRDLTSNREKTLGGITQPALATWTNSIAWSEDSRTISRVRRTAPAARSSPVRWMAARPIASTLRRYRSAASRRAAGCSRFKAMSTGKTWRAPARRQSPSPISSKLSMTSPSRPPLRPTAPWPSSPTAPAATPSGS